MLSKYVVCFVKFLLLLFYGFGSDVIGRLVFRCIEMLVNIISDLFVELLVFSHCLCLS